MQPISSGYDCGMSAELDLDSHSLRVVDAIAEHGSITAAADALGYSQPAISQHLKRLDQRIGMPVVERVGRGVRLLVVVGVWDGVRRGVYDGLVGRTGVVDGASSAAVVIVVTGVSWLVTLLSVVRMTNHPTPAIRARADKEARSGPTTPLRVGRLWLVMLCSLAQARACQLLRRPRFTTV